MEIPVYNRKKSLYYTETHRISSRTFLLYRIYCIFKYCFQTDSLQETLRSAIIFSIIRIGTNPVSKIPVGTGIIAPKKRLSVQ